MDEDKKKLNNTSLYIENLIGLLYIQRDIFLRNNLYTYAQKLEKVAIKIYVKFVILCIELEVKHGIAVEFPTILKPVFLRSDYCADSAFRDIMNRFQFIKDMFYIRKVESEHGIDAVTKDLLLALEIERDYPANNFTKRCVRNVLNSIDEVCEKVIKCRLNDINTSSNSLEKERQISDIDIPELPANTKTIFPTGQQLKQTGETIWLQNDKYRRI